MKRFARILLSVLLLTFAVNGSALAAAPLPIAGELTPVVTQAIRGGTQLVFRQDQTAINALRNVISSE